MVNLNAVWCAATCLDNGKHWVQDLIISKKDATTLKGMLRETFLDVL